MTLTRIRLAAWQQFLQVMECKRCGYSKGRRWRKIDDDGQPVVITVEPCPKHQQMFNKQGWVEE